MSLLSDLRFALRSLLRVKGLAITVIVTLALGIGANAAIFSVVRGVLMRPLVNRDEASLIYIRQSAPGLGADNAAFSVPEIQDLRAGVKSIAAFGDFSQIGFTMVGLGEPRVVRAGVVGGNYFDVMGLKPVMGRLIGPKDDGPNAPGVAVLTYRYWTSGLGSDPHVLGKVVRLDERSATIIGVLEPSVPYPAETEIIANIVTSPHHLSATMVTGRVHRMTELFGRLAPGATIDTARAELSTVHSAMVHSHPEAYSSKANFKIEARPLREEIAAPARTVLLILLAASGLVFLIACSNVANLILARSVRREGELAVRAALGASTAALRRTLLAESLVLCGAGAVLGVLVARPMVAILAQYASRFSVRALDLTVDASLLWVGVGLAALAAILLAFVPRLPGADTTSAVSLASGSLRITTGTNRRLRLFAVTQIAASFVLLAGSGMLLTTLMALQATRTGFDMDRVLAVNVPVMTYGKTPDQVIGFYKEAMRRITALPGVERVAVGTVVPWRDKGAFGPGFEFTTQGYPRATGEEDPRARFRTISPGFFDALGVPLIAGRDFTEADRKDGEQVVIVSQSVAKRMFNNGDAINHYFMWTDPVMQFIDVSTKPRRIVGIAADIDDEDVVPGQAMSIYHPMDQEIGGGRMFVHTKSDPYALVPEIRQIIRTLSPDQPVEKPATLTDVRAEVLAPDRLNALVFGVFAGVALLIAVVGVAGVLAFSVSARTREFGVRLAIGSAPAQLLVRVLSEGAVIAGLGIVAGVLGGLLLAKLVGAYVTDVKMPGALPIAAAGLLLVTAAVLASLMPAARASRVDVIQALRSE
jgi:predicted permease